MSWREESIEEIINGPSEVHLATADQCAYGIVTPSADKPGEMMPALKPTKFLTNSEVMARQLSLRCPKNHDHQPLVGGRCKDAAMYPIDLVKAILKGISLQAKEAH